MKCFTIAITRFVGVPPTDQLQQFIVRCVTAYGDRIQGNDISEAEISKLNAQMANMAGNS
jgi:hypothetical protein